ncbi:hypothetical protein WA158_003803 [Blastocystis sp. Blastoise]
MHHTHENNINTNIVIADLIVPLDDIIFGDLINHGAFGDVYEGWYDNKPVAIKYSNMGNKNHKTVLSEINAMRVLSHPNIIQLYAVAESDNGFYLIMERGEMDLEHWVRKQQPIDVLDTLKSIAHAIGYMHSFDPPYIHRDIKPSNILIMADGQVKLSDFGLSLHCDIEGRHMSDVGTPSFVAPEVCTHTYDERVDIYSFGLLVYYLISGGKTVPQEGEQEKYRNNFVSKALYLLYKQCCETDPNKRPTLTNIEARLEKLIKFTKKSSKKETPKFSFGSFQALSYRSSNEKKIVIASSTNEKKEGIDMDVMSINL